MFSAEAGSLRDALGSNVADLHHIGSTAIPGMAAKPVIDILVEVNSLSAVDHCNREMAAIGYEARGEYGIAGRRYFRKPKPEKPRTHNVHVFEIRSADIVRHLAFRDFMRGHRAEARRYCDLKIALAAAFPDDLHAYMDGKDAFIKEMESKALDWRAG